MKQKQQKVIRLDSLQELQQINRKRMFIQRIKDNHNEKLFYAKKELQDLSPPKGKVNINKQETGQKTEKLPLKAQKLDKNEGISDTDKMLFDKRFKNFLNHKQEYIGKARQKAVSKSNKPGQRKNNEINGSDQYYNEEQVLSNTGSDYQYRDADDMQAAYQQMTTGKKRKGAGKQLFHCEYYENMFRKVQFQNLIQISESNQQSHTISKQRFLNYLFDEPSVMMLYSINPYQLGDQLAEFQTKVNEFLTYEQFSAFLLTDRQPTYFEYSPQVLAEARKLGRGIKCAPIIAKWIDQTGILEFLIDIYKSIDMHGDGKVDKVFLAKKIRKEAEQRRIMEVEVVEIVNIDKRIPLNRLLYEIQFQQRENEDWTFEEFEQFLTNYKRRSTPQKDRLITKLILAGKFDNSYVYILSQEILEIVKEIFGITPKFAQYFVVKQKFLNNLVKDPRYKRIQNLYVRSESNRYVKKETFEDTLVRIYAEGQHYLDIQEILDFLTNRGRPKIVEYRVYIENLQRQLMIIEEEEVRKREKYGEDYDATSSDEEFKEIVKQKRISRKKNKLLQIRNQNAFSHGKRFNVTIPTPFGFDIRDKHKKVSIRQQKLKQMLAQKERQYVEAMTPFKCKEVPAHVKDNLYEKLLKDQQRERRERLERFRLEIMSQIHVSERLMMPKSTEIHCDFSSEEYKFVARPMPWYCQVNLLGRINKQKQQRRQKILQELINRNGDFDLPEGVQRMIKRQEQLEQKRAAKRTVSTGSVGDCTFIPKISHGVPDFKTIHQHLHFDLQNAKDVKQPAKIEPFSFENRPAKSRTTYQTKKPTNINNIRHSKYQKAQNQEDFTNIPKTQKFQALVQLRRKQLEQKQKSIERQKRQQAVRKLREQKFAPIVRKVLKQNTPDINQSRAVIADRIKQFKREEKKKKVDYENQMIKIYTKVFQRPLLVQSGGVQEKQPTDEGRSPNHKNVGESQLKKSKKKQHKQSNKQREYKHLRFMDLDNERRRVVEEHHPGNYPIDDEFHESDMYDEEYEEEGNVYTS